jgi:hypothetical protein
MRIGLVAERASDSLSSWGCSSHLRRETCENGGVRCLCVTAIGRGVMDQKTLQRNRRRRKLCAYQELPSVLFPFCSANR